MNSGGLSPECKLRAIRYAGNSAIAKVAAEVHHDGERAEGVMRLATMLGLPLIVLASPACSQEQASNSDREAAFRAAGFSQVGGQWRACDAPDDSIYTPGEIERFEDLNGDGRPEAIITEGSTFCYGGDEVGFFLVSQLADSSWKLLLQTPGIANVLTTKGTGGWPDIEVGGQGFCFPVQRWNGTEYAIHRFEYEGQACTLER